MRIQWIDNKTIFIFPSNDGEFLKLKDLFSRPFHTADLWTCFICKSDIIKYMWDFYKLGLL